MTMIAIMLGCAGLGFVAGKLCGPIQPRHEIRAAKRKARFGT